MQTPGCLQWILLAVVALLFYRCCPVMMGYFGAGVASLLVVSKVSEGFEFKWESR